MDPRERSKIYNGASDAWTRAVELTVTPLVFGYLGFRLDRWAGTGALFTIVFAAFCLGYEVWKMWSGYESAMQVHEAELLARRRPGGDRGVVPGQELVGP